MILAESVLRVFGILTNNIYYFVFVGAVYLTLLSILRKRWVLAIFFLLGGIVWLGFYDMGIIPWLIQLGVDSMAELSAIDAEETFFWLKTVLVMFQPDLHGKRFILFLTLSIFSFVLLWFLLQKLSLKAGTTEKYVSLVAYLLIAVGLFSTFYGVVASYKKYITDFTAIASNFDLSDVTLPLLATSKEISLVVYIGESTSILNMSLYGYPRDTTPNLTQIQRSDPNMLVFNKVFSTHTHTSPSLLEAFSFALSKEDNTMPIENQKRIRLVDMLRIAGIESTLVSNQGLTGSWNQASTIIFKTVSSSFFSYDLPGGTNVEYSTTTSGRVKKPFDAEFFDNQPTSVLTGKNRQHLLFLHSRAGHGEYLNNIPSEFAKKVDNLFSGFNSKAIVGENKSFFNEVEAYDSAIKYVDYSVSKALNEVKNLTEPAIFLYFSDHGDSVFTGRGHDSSRFIHEMARVPFIIYFNEAARNEHPLLFEKYNSLAKADNLATLAQLPSTILDLMQISVAGSKKENNSIVLTNIIGEKGPLSPILVRRVNNEIQFINLNKEDMELSEVHRDNTDVMTKILKASTFNESGTRVCYHRSNTLAKFIRAKLIANCIELDLVVDSNGTLNVYHPPAENTLLNLDFILDMVFSNEHALWIDAKNLDNPNNCITLYNRLKNYGYFRNQVLVEFPSKALSNLKTLKACASNFNKIGIFTSYYVPTDLANTCSQQIRDGKKVSAIYSCLELSELIMKASESGVFTDISFDSAGIIAIESMDIPDGLRWNAWNVHADDFFSLNSDRLRMVILKNDDPNDL